MGMSVRVNTRGEAQEYLLPRSSILCYLVEQGKLIKIVHHNASHPPTHRHLQFLTRLVIAVKVDLRHGEAHRFGDGKLPRGDHIETQPLFLEELRQCPVDEGFTGVYHQAIGVTLRKPLSILGTLTPQRHFVKDIERRAKFTGQLPDVASADDEMVFFDLSGLNSLSIAPSFEG